MRKCPTCQETFGDEKKFCQKDGTPLVDVVEPPPLDDPFKTVIGAPPPATSPNISDDVMKTFVVSSENKEEDILQIPEAFDPMKTMVASDPIKYKEPTTSTPPPNEPVVPAPEPPKFSEPNLSPPVFNDFSTSEPPKTETPNSFSPPPVESPKAESPQIPNPFSAPPTMVETPKVEASPLPSESAPPTESPFDKPFSPSIPSPFDPPKFNDPVATPSPFNEPVATPPVLNEPEPMKMDDPKPFGSSPFDPPAASFGQPANDPFNQPNDPFNQPVQDNAAWNPLSPPASSWGDQPVADNMSGIPPAPVGASGGSPSSVLAIISLVVGVLGFLSIAVTLLIPFCGIIPFGLGIAAAVLGFLARSRAKSDPSQYSGGGLGLVGLILGVLSIIGPILIVVLYMALFGAMQFVPR